jgi:hypothetical protein
MPSDFSKGFGNLGQLMGSTAAGAIGNIASGAANALFGGIQARRNWKYKQKEMALQQKYNLENMQKQFQYQQEAWDRENRYNDPRNASARWRLAGISPNAVFGNSPGGAGVAGSAGTPDVSNPSAGGNVDTSSYHPTLTPVEMMRAQNEQKIADSQADLNKALADKARGDTKDPDITKRSQIVQLSRDEIAKETEEVQRDILNIQKGFVEAKESNDVAIQRAKYLEIIANCTKLLADKNVSEEMREKLEADKELAQEMVNTEKAKQRNLDADTDLKDAYRKTENDLRDGKIKIQQSEAKRVIQSAFNGKLKNMELAEQLARIMTGSDRSSSLYSILDKAIESIGTREHDEKENVRRRFLDELRNFEYLHE